MFKSKLIKLLMSALLACIAITPAGCSSTDDANDEDGFFTKVVIAKADGSEAYTPTINADPSEDIEVALLSGEIYEVCKNYRYYITDSYNVDGVDVFAPTPLTVSWESQDTPLYYIFEISTNEDMSDAESFVTFDTSITFNYLFMGYKYYYRIQAKFEDRIVKSRIFKFSTSYLPRTVFIDNNVSNTRDWGGFLCSGGTHRVKQGVVYRGGKLENITESGKKVMLDDLKIKTDLDVRGDGTAGTDISPLGSGVNYIETTGPYYLGTNGIDSPNYREALLTEIRAFANADNFPIYVHCSLGRDRTGTLCFLINALLGVNEKDLYIDYEISMMSAMGHADGQSATNMVGSAFRGLLNYIKYYSYGSLAANTEKFMLDIGITEEEIAAIKENMLEEVK